MPFYIQIRNHGIGLWHKSCFTADGIKWLDYILCWKGVLYPFKNFDMDMELLFGKLKNILALMKYRDFKSTAVTIPTRHQSISMSTVSTTDLPNHHPNQHASQPPNGVLVLRWHRLEAFHRAASATNIPHNIEHCQKEQSNLNKNRDLGNRFGLFLWRNLDV